MDEGGGLCASNLRRDSRRVVSLWVECPPFLYACQAAELIFIPCCTSQNGNTIPITTWAVMELAKDPILFKAVREEFKTVLKVDTITGRRYVDKRALFSLPLLQSVYTEVLRLHVSINVTREVVGPLTMEGLSLEKGSMVQAPSEIAHREEGIWSAPGHPASEFWAERHVKHVDEATNAGEGGPVPQFSLAGRSNDFFPYGALKKLLILALSTHEANITRQAVAYPCAPAGSLPNMKSCLPWGYLLRDLTLSL